ncbi:histidine kinase-, DNA gyrase b-, and HSP90-like ATPase domain-containing protein [Ditylenchus destructor]|uniref:histidine kinase n=1 Tax=Ditylenchus destructor TaxID=166010 RepID=A0AAD4MGZ3_9BILA|nr:histidine kinase-, DNA gyrase b-, and HSP90-like ATPase domain-containing protein [Ditylenchus destructor]
MHEQEVVQRLSLGLAAHIAENSELMKPGGLDQAAVKDLFDKLMAVNPSVEVYLLGLDGRIEAQAAPPGHLKRDRVDLGAPPQAAVGRAAADRGGRSSQPERREGGEDHDALVANVAADNVLRTTLWTMGLVSLLGLLAGLAAFRLITRPLRELTAAVKRFESEGIASLEGEAPTLERLSHGSDEIAQLGQAFAQMTRRIAEQWRELTLQDQQRRELFANISHDLRTRDLAARLPRDAAAQGRHARRGGAAPLPRDRARPEPQGGPAGAGGLRAGAARIRRGQAREGKLRARRPGAGRVPEVRAGGGGQAPAPEARHRAGPAGGVSDTGPGIPGELQKAIFTRPVFMSGSRSEGTASSGGLGLVIVKRILQLHGSDIRLVEQPDKGAVFRFQLGGAAAG